MPAEVIKLLDTEHILSYLLVLVVIGAGRWFKSQGWPEIAALLKYRAETERRRAELENEREAQQISVTAENDRLLARQFENLSAAFNQLTGEMRASNAIQQTVVNFLIHILEGLNGGKVTNVITEETPGGRG